MWRKPDIERRSPGWTPREAAKVLAMVGMQNISCKISHFSSGKTMHSPGMAGGACFLLSKGIAGLFYNLPDVDCLVQLVYPGQMAAVGRYPGDPYTQSLVSLTECDTYRLPAGSQVLGEPREGIVALYEGLTIHAAAQAAELIRMRTLSPLERLDYHIRELAGFIGTRDDLCGHLRLTLPFSDEPLAALVGVSPRQFKRIKKQYQSVYRIRYVTPRILVIPIS